jgi:hypothetical protein
MHGYLFKVFEAAAQEQPARQRAPEGDRGGRERLMSAAGFPY